MENSITGNLPNNGQTLVDKVDDHQDDGAGPALMKAVRRTKSAGRQSFDAIKDMASQARDTASSASDSMVAYTKKNPVSALAIAAVSGALIYAVIKALTPSRD